MGDVVRLVRSGKKPVPTGEPVRLTKRTVEDLRATADGTERFLWDAELKGFGVRASRSGLRSYFVQYRDIRGRTRRIAIGRHGVLTAEEARKLAVQRLAEVARGKNPAAELKAQRAKAKQARTVQQLAERFMCEHVEVKRKPRTIAGYRILLDAYVLPALGPLPVESVTRPDVEALHLRMRRTPVAANRVLALLSAMFGFAEAWGLRPLQTNPCYRIERYRERPRERFYTPDELKRVGAALAAAEHARTIPDGPIAALRLLALTGCRPSEVLELEPSHVDLDVGVLRLADAKTGARNVPLGAPAIALLRELLPSARGRVVAGYTPNDPLNLRGLHRAWEKIRKAAGLEVGARPYDLRHTVGTYAGQSSLNAFMVRDLLGHKTLAMSNRYVSQDTNPLRRAADQVAGRIADAMAGKSANGRLHAERQPKRTE